MLVSVDGVGRINSAFVVVIVLTVVMLQKWMRLWQKRSRMGRVAGAQMDSSRARSLKSTRKTRP